MDAPELDAFLICGDAPTAALTGPALDGEGAAEPVFDPARWVLVGWRNARGAPPVTWQQLAAVTGNTQGPCVGCGTLHHRYGEGGRPHCPACRTKLDTVRK